jgi:hypothetical protein
MEQAEAAAKTQFATSIPIELVHGFERDRMLVALKGEDSIRELRQFTHISKQHTINELEVRQLLDWETDNLETFTEMLSWWKSRVNTLEPREVIRWMCRWC